MKKRWIFLLVLSIFVAGDYIKRRDFFHQEENIRYKNYETLSTLVPEGYTIHGIDVSRHNGEIWWEKISEAEIDSNRIVFAFAKSTEGMFFYDKEFLDNWQTAKKYKMIRGAYHFFRPTFSPSLQAWNFIFNTRLKKGDLPPVLDIEVDEGYTDMDLVIRMKKWISVIERHYGVKPIIYTNVKFYKRVVQGHFDDYPLWIAQYNVKKPNLPENTAWNFWQYSDKGTIYGINEKVDLNVFKGSKSTLLDMCLK